MLAIYTKESVNAKDDRLDLDEARLVMIFKCPKPVTLLDNNLINI